MQRRIWADATPESDPSNWAPDPSDPRAVMPTVSMILVGWVGERLRRRGGCDMVMSGRDFTRPTSLDRTHGSLDVGNSAVVPTRSRRGDLLQIEGRWPIERWRPHGGGR